MKVMLKIIGAVLILFAGTMIGMVQAARFAARPRQIRQLIHALQRLETEIGYGQTLLPVALGSIGAKLPAPLAALFAEMADSLHRRSDGSGETLEACWSRIIQAGWPRTAMKVPEKETLLRLGSTLGTSGREDQLKHLRLAGLQLQAEEAAAREEQMKYEKLSRSLGALAAALTVILMI